MGRFAVIFERGDDVAFIEDCALEGSAEFDRGRHGYEGGDGLAELGDDEGFAGCGDIVEELEATSFEFTSGDGGHGGVSSIVIDYSHKIVHDELVVKRGAVV